MLRIKPVKITIPAGYGYVLTSKKTGTSFAVVDVNFLQKEIFKQIPKQDGKLVIAVTHNTTYYADGDATVDPIRDEGWFAARRVSCFDDVDPIDESVGCARFGYDMDSLKLCIGAAMTVDNVELWFFDDRHREGHNSNETGNDRRCDYDGKRKALHAGSLPG